MPRFNPSTGAIATLRRDWYDATLTAFQDCSHAVIVNGVPTCQIVLSDGTKLARANSGLVTAGGGIAAWLRNEDATVYDTRGRRWSGAGLSERGMSPDGALALKVVRDSYGPWDVVETDDSRWRLTDGDAHNIQLLGDRQAIWMIGVDDFCTPGLPIAIPLEHHYGLRAAWVPDQARFLTLYQRASDGALVCDGRLVAPPADDYFYPDLEYRDGRVRITWATTQADADAQVLELTRAQLAARPLSLQTPPAVTMPAINRRLLCGWFTDHATGAPGNADIWVDFHGAPAANALVRRDNGEVLAHYVAAEAEGTIDALERAIAAAHVADPQLPTICYWPVSLQAIRVPIGADLVGVVAYRWADEPLTLFEARVRRAVSVCPAAMLIAQCYTSNAANTTDLASVVPVYARIARECRNVVGIVVFSAGSRATGFDAHPEVADLWRALYGSVLGLPTLPAPHVSQPPSVPPPAPHPTPQPDPAPAPVSPQPVRRFPAAHVYGVSR